jgi:translocation and assembly module TamB
VIEGNGNIRRTKDGALFGEAHVSSASGRVSEAAAAPREDATDALLTYQNLKVDAQLAGDTAQGSISTSLNGGGRLEGEATLANLRGAEPSIDGKAKLTIPDLNVACSCPNWRTYGAAEANVEVTGRWRAADHRHGQLRQLAAEVPSGHQAYDGNWSMSPGNAIKLSGKVGSGRGQVTLDGATTAAGVLNVKVQGNDFQAADIPGANVIIAPDLTFERSPERMLLGGTVTVPKAQIDLTKRRSIRHAGLAGRRGDRRRVGRGEVQERTAGGARHRDSRQGRDPRRLRPQRQGRRPARRPRKAG